MSSAQGRYVAMQVMKDKLSLVCLMVLAIMEKQHQCKRPSFLGVLRNCTALRFVNYSNYWVHRIISVFSHRLYVVIDMEILGVQ